MTTTQQQPRKYHLFYNEEQIKPGAVQIVRKLITQDHFFKQDQQTKLNLLNKLNKDLSNFYNIPIANLVLQPGCLGIGCYRGFDEVILINKPSLVTFLHEFKHHLNHKTQQHNNNRQIEEDTARGFSHSLYYLASPNLFKNAVEKGLIIFQKSL